MERVTTAIPIDHHPAVHEVEMYSADEAQDITLLELIDAVSEVSECEEEVIATVTYMLSSGRVRLAGNFRDVPVAKLCG